MRTFATSARATLLAAVALLAVGCSATDRPVDLATVDSVDRPQPVGVEENPAPPSTSNKEAPACDPTKSYRPMSPLPPRGQMPPDTTMRKIQDAGKLIVGVDQNTFLFGFRNPTTNALEGFDIDRARELAMAIFGDSGKVQFQVLTSKDRETALQEGRVHVVVRTYSATCERWQLVNFSSIYYTAGQRLLVERSSTVTGIDQLRGKKVCANKGSTSIKTLIAHPAKPVPVAVDNWSDCLIMLQQGQVDAVSTDDTILLGMVVQDPNLKLVGPQFTQEPYGIGIPKGDVTMTKFVNGVLADSVASGAWQASYDRWLGRTGEPAPPPPAPTAFLD